MNDMKVKSGAEVMVNRAEEFLRGQKIGLICNPTSVLPRFRYLADSLIDDDGVELAALFGPEHGLFATVQDQVGIGQFKYSGVPVYSLYGETKESIIPTVEMLENCDRLVFDIQDVGSRYYTYVWTMTICMEVCARLKKPLIVCDRPNPLGGVEVEGPMLQGEFESFVGRHPVCTRHGMTPGEIAQMVNVERKYNCDLTVIPCEGWARGMWFNETGLDWVMPSPNMPTLETAVVYPGGCLIEGTNLSEGRGTTRPFELVGAPFLDGKLWADRMNVRRLPGVTFRAVQFEPAFHKFAGQTCNGLFVHVTDRESFLSIETYVALIVEAKKMAPKDFLWRTRPYEFEKDRLAIDLLFGGVDARLAIESGEDVATIAKTWRSDVSDFKVRRDPYLLYS